MVDFYDIKDDVYVSSHVEPHLCVRFQDTAS
jgi:hypothetical protein